MNMENAIRPPRASASRLGLQVLGAALLGSVLTVTVILPTEYGLDPTGFGALTGLKALSAPPELVVETKLSAPPEIARAWCESEKSLETTQIIEGLVDHRKSDDCIDDIGVHANSREDTE